MKVLICPYCGLTQPASDRCQACCGLFEPLSRQATHNAMGPWFVRETARPFQPGCSYETLERMIDRGQVTKDSIIRGPTTRQFWTMATRVPGVGHLLGCCPKCDASVDRADHECHACGESFAAIPDRNDLGLPQVQPLPDQTQLDEGSPRAAVTSPSSDRPRPDHSSGISRFASDEELLGAGSRVEAVGVMTAGPDPAGGSLPSGTEPSVAATGQLGVDRFPFSSPSVPDVSLAPRGVFDENASATVTRALRRRLAAKQRTVRILAILLIVVAVVTVLSNLDAITSIFGGSSTDQSLRGSAAPGAVDAVDR